MENFGNGFPYPEDVQSERELEELCLKQLLRFQRDRNATVREKARTFVDVEDEAAKIRFSRNRTPYSLLSIPNLRLI